jgi:hypothetical protein
MDNTATQININELKQKVNTFVNVVNQIEVENAAAIRSKEQMETTINRIMEDNKSNKEALDIATHAIEILRQVSDEAVSQAYSFLESSLNAALERMFANTTRKIEIKEYIRNNQYPQLELVLHVGNGKTRSLKSDSGHGLAQIVSLLSILSLIVITGSRRILVMDEIISGLSVHNREVVADILWSFTEIGFQFIVNDHGFIIPNSHVYHLEMNGDVSTVKKHYIATKGVFLQGESGKVYDYEDKIAIDNVDSNTEEIEEYPEQEQVQPIQESGGVVADTSTGDNVLSI